LLAKKAVTNKTASKKRKLNENEDAAEEERKTGDGQQVWIPLRMHNELTLS
jgi:hypothetical protein